MNIKLEISDYSSSDIVEVWNWVPESKREVFFQLEIEVSEVGKEGGNLFQLVVATTEGLQNFKLNYPEESLPSKGLIVIEEYSWKALLDRLNAELKFCTMNSWQESIECLRKKFLWEYEDYK